MFRPIPEKSPVPGRMRQGSKWSPRFVPGAFLYLLPTLHILSVRLSIPYREIVSDQFQACDSPLTTVACGAVYSSWALTIQLFLEVCWDQKQNRSLLT